MIALVDNLPCHITERNHFVPLPRAKKIYWNGIKLDSEIFAIVNFAQFFGGKNISTDQLLIVKLRVF